MPLLRLRRDEGGNALISFALIVPLLISITMGIIEFALIAFEYHRAGEAARYAARRASMMAPIADMTPVENGNTVTCTEVAGEVNCGGATVENPGTFTAVLDFVKKRVPSADGENVVVRYEPSGLGDPDTPAGILPVLTVRLTGVEHQFLVLNAAGVFGSGITFPNIDSTTVSSSVDSTNV